MFGYNFFYYLMYQGTFTSQSYNNAMNGRQPDESLGTRCSYSMTNSLWVKHLIPSTSSVVLCYSTYCKIMR